MLKSYDWECPKCDLVFDTLGSTEQKWKKCPRCGKRAKKIISTRGALNATPAWIQKNLEVVDKEDKSPITQEFIRTGSRTARKKWMRAEGIREMHEGEKTITREDRAKATEQKLDGIIKEVVREQEKNRRIEVRG